LTIDLRDTIDSVHRRLGGKWWIWRLGYARSVSAGTVEEHLHTRLHSGLFDVSHMGEIEVRGTTTQW